MKIRNGFVSNSSSSSFVILKRYLSEEQINKTFNYYKVIKKYLKKHPDSNKFEYFDNYWVIKDFEDFIFGETSMDNLDFSEFFNVINVDNKYACYDDGYINSPTSYQMEFINNERKKLRKDKLNKLKKNEQL